VRLAALNADSLRLSRAAPAHRANVVEFIKSQWIEFLLTDNSDRCESSVLIGESYAF
jgi:hypothetical protein